MTRQKNQLSITGDVSLPARRKFSAAVLSGFLVEQSKRSATRGMAEARREVNRDSIESLLLLDIR